ncbi:MAG: arginine deiminase, partial [Bacteroidales bacterium]|nr:arginine deiminase [Bacteroidales bacterium]
MNGSKFKVEVNSEIGELEAVMLHTPGPEVENMTPKSIERALYSDILNLSVAQPEYTQLSCLLGTVCQVFQVK